MVIKTIFGNGDLAGSTRSTTRRNIIKNLQIASIREGFYAQRESYRWGMMYEIKGTERHIMNTFGKLPNGETLTGAIALQHILQEQL